VARVKDTGIAEFVGKDLKAAIAELEKRMRGRRPIWSSRRRGGCATRSGGWRRWTWGWSRRRPRVRRCGTTLHRAVSATARRSRWDLAVAGMIRASGVGEGGCGVGGRERGGAQTGALPGLTVHGVH
jgi:hypothetical protein